jgi:hypothetical protein
MRRLGASLTLRICDGNTADTDEGHVDRPGADSARGNPRLHRARFQAARSPWSSAFWIVQRRSCSRRAAEFDYRLSSTTKCGSFLKDRIGSFAEFLLEFSQLYLVDF